jgi:hypothetical protein
MIFASDVPRSQIRFLQVQSDIVVDQLHYGRYGANARECLMLGKPVICRLMAEQEPLPPLQPILESPMVNATESNIYDVLKSLLLDPGRRARLGQESRAFAMKWHAAPCCAHRFERIIDRVARGQAPEADEVFA